MTRVPLPPPCDYAPCWPLCLCTLLLCVFLLPVLSPLFPGQISLAPWGPMRRPSWLMCRVTTTRSQASRRWEMNKKKSLETIIECCWQEMAEMSLIPHIYLTLWGQNEVNWLVCWQICLFVWVISCLCLASFQSEKVIFKAGGTEFGSF